MKKLVYALLALGMASCGDKTSELPENQLTGNDFESLDGWIGDNVMPSLTREKAHLGRYSAKVDPNVEYSIGYSNLLGKMSASKLRKIKVHVWVNIPNAKTEAVLVTQVTDPGNPTASPLLWEGIKLSDKVTTYNKWVEVEKEITLPDNVTYANKIGVYLWRTAVPGTAFIDDLTITKIE